MSHFESPRPDLHCKFLTLCGLTLTTKKQTTKFSSANFRKKKVKFKLYHIENSEIRGQTV